MHNSYYEPPDEFEDEEVLDYDDDREYDSLREDGWSYEDILLRRYRDHYEDILLRSYQDDYEDSLLRHYRDYEED